MTLFLVPAIHKKWKNSLNQVADANTYFDNICASVGELKTKEWTELEEELQNKRVDDVTVMDDFDVRNEKGELQGPLIISGT